MKTHITLKSCYKSWKIHSGVVVIFSHADEVYGFEIEAEANITRAEKVEIDIRFRSDFNGELRDDGLM